MNKKLALTFLNKRSLPLIIFQFYFSYEGIKKPIFTWFIKSENLQIIRPVIANIKKIIFSNSKEKVSKKLLTPSTPMPKEIINKNHLAIGNQGEGIRPTNTIAPITIAPTIKLVKKEAFCSSMKLSLNIISFQTHYNELFERGNTHDH